MNLINMKARGNENNNNNDNTNNSVTGNDMNC